MFNDDPLRIPQKHKCPRCEADLVKLSQKNFKNCTICEKEVNQEKAHLGCENLSCSFKPCLECFCGYANGVDVLNKNSEHRSALSCRIGADEKTALGVKTGSKLIEVVESAQATMSSRPVPAVRVTLFVTLDGKVTEHTFKID